MIRYDDPILDFPFVFVRLLFINPLTSLKKIENGRESLTKTKGTRRQRKTDEKKMFQLSSDGLEGRG